MMYNILLLINATFFIYVFAVFITPQKTLFFIKDKKKRKRVPYSLMVLAAYIIFFAVASPMIEKTPERIAEREVQADENAATLIEEEINKDGELLRADDKEWSEYLNGTWKSKDGYSTIAFTPLSHAVSYDYRSKDAPGMPHMIRITLKVEYSTQNNTKTYFGALDYNSQQYLRLFNNINGGQGNSKVDIELHKISRDTISIKDLNYSNNSLNYIRMNE